MAEVFLFFFSSLWQSKTKRVLNRIRFFILLIGWLLHSWKWPWSCAAFFLRGDVKDYYHNKQQQKESTDFKRFFHTQNKKISKVCRLLTRCKFLSLSLPFFISLSLSSDHVAVLLCQGETNKTREKIETIPTKIRNFEVCCKFKSTNSLNFNSFFLIWWTFSKSFITFKNPIVKHILHVEWKFHPMTGFLLVI